MNGSNLTHQNTFSNPRGTGYSIGGVRKTTLRYDAASGRLVGMAAGSDNFTWEYLAGTQLKSKLTYPNAATAEWTYEAERDLIACVKNTVNGNVISQYDYAHDALGRRVSAAKSGTMMAASENLAYGYNARSELVSAVSDTDANYNYAYAFDHIGNRETEAVAGTENAYATNSLNQYLSVTPAESPAFNPSYDADGNVTSVQTSTGTWAVEYNAENRPVRWTNAATGTVITMSFDSQGRRTEYKSVTNGAQNTWLRFLYDGYLCVQVLYSNEPYNVFKEFVWDPTESVATRPLVFRYAPNSLNLFYAFDGNKNVSDVFYRMTSNGIGAHYDYAPFGNTTRTHRDSSASFDIVALNPFRFSSEYYDSELDLVYYNYRHYSPSLGRFLSRDPIQEQGGLNLYAFVGNDSLLKLDVLGALKTTSFLFATYISRAQWHIPLEPVVFSDIDNEVRNASQVSIAWALREYLKLIAHDKKGRQKIRFRDFNIAPFDSRRYLSVTTQGLKYTVNSSSTVLISGDVSFCCFNSRVFSLGGEINVTWVDEMDANSFWEYYNKEIVNGGGWSLGGTIAWLGEGIVDLVGDRLLNANFDFNILYQIDLDHLN